MRTELYHKLQDSQREVERLKTENGQLAYYRMAYERTVTAALTAPSTEGDSGDRAVLQAVILNIPSSIPRETIERSCKDQEKIRAAINPLIAERKVVAGERPAWDALMNCALGNVRTSGM